MTQFLRGRKRGRNPLDEILETVRVHIDGEPKDKEEGAGYMVARILKEQKARIAALELELKKTKKEKRPAYPHADNLVETSTREVGGDKGKLTDIVGPKKTPLRMPVTTDAEPKKKQEKKKVAKKSKAKKKKK